MGCVWSSIPVAFFKVRQQPKLYRMYAIQRQFNQDHANSYNHLVIIIYGIRRKKTIKKAS